MTLFKSFFNMKVGIVDLTNSSVKISPLDEDRISRYLGGAAINRSFLHENEDFLIFGTGALTGSFAPASSLLTATFASPFSGKACHVPFMITSGTDMKFSGIDFLLIRGIAAEKTMLYINNGSIRIMPANNLGNIPLDESIPVLKKNIVRFPFKSSILTGPAADLGASFASASLDAKGSLDKGGLAALMASKNLKGIVFGATGGLPFDTDHPEQAQTLERRIFVDKNLKKAGFFSVLERLDGGSEAKNFLKKLRKKDMACFRCPSPCMTHITFDSKALGMPETKKTQDGLLLFDHSGFIELFRKIGRYALPVFQKCLSFGVDPSYVAKILKAGGTLNDYIDTIERLDYINPKTETSNRKHCLFGGGISSILPEEQWKKRVSLAIILGICPIFLLRFTQISEADLLAFISRNEATQKALQKMLSSENLESYICS